jgi:prolyl 4-hydroxylase
MNRTGAADQANALAEARQFDRAVGLLDRAAAEGDAEAQFTLALWRIVGTIVRRDLGIARALLAAAAANGHLHAALIHSCFLAAGTGGPADWPAAVRALEAVAARDAGAAEQLRLIGTLDLGEDGLPRHPLEVERLSEAPRVWCARGFASTQECDYLLARAEPQLQPSMVVDPDSGRMIPHPIRNSEGAYFGVTQEDPVINALNRRIAALSGTVQDQGESLQVLRYRPGMEYKPHLDALAGETNQRILTCLVYLTDGYEGGETCFLETGLSFKGRRGDALLFANVLPDGRPDPEARHAGLPVRRGVKTIASRWIRARPFVYPPPVPATGDRFG